jgi:hypothetical protein
MTFWSVMYVIRQKFTSVSEEHCQSLDRRVRWVNKQQAATLLDTAVRTSYLTQLLFIWNWKQSVEENMTT